MMCNSSVKEINVNGLFRLNHIENRIVFFSFTFSLSRAPHSLSLTLASQALFVHTFLASNLRYLCQRSSLKPKTHDSVAVMKVEMKAA